MGFCCSDAKSDHDAKIDHKSARKTIETEDETHLDEIVKSSSVNIARKSLPLGHSDYKSKFPIGDHRVGLIIQVSDFKTCEIGDSVFLLKCGRGKNVADCIKGTYMHHGDVREGAVEIYMNMFFHEDGIPDEKKAKLELFKEGKTVGFARFNLGLFYEGEILKVDLKN